MGRYLTTAHPLLTFATVILLTTKTAIVAQPGWSLTAAHPLTAFTAIVLLAPEATIVTQICRLLTHFIKVNIALSHTISTLPILDSHQ